MKRTLLMLLVAGLLSTGLAWAQEEEDAPGRGVARISLVNGDVSIRRGDSGDWVASAVNAPLVAGDSILTGANSHAEVQFDWGTFVRLGPDTEVRLSDLDNKRYQAQVARGTVMLSVLRDTDADVEVDTPNVSVRPVKRSDCRITVREDGQSEVTVRSGEVEAFTPKGVERVASGRTMMVRGTADSPEYHLVRAIEEDSFDRWNEERDHRLARTRSYEYVSRDIYGADDLDAYGRWVYVAPYGWVWSPSGMAPDWAPYRSGRWSWIDYYGWTWVSYDPWGWAPYHYGRWFWDAPYGWCWFPGPVGYHHFWRPALVAFFGFGRGFNFGFGFGNVGWVPLAPYETFYPWYGRNMYGYGRRGYIGNSVRIVNNVDIHNVYRNARIVNGVTGVDSGGFVRGRVGTPIRVGEAIGRSAAVVRGPMPITPSADSLRVSDRTLSPTALRASGREPRFYTQRQAAPVERVPFETQRQNIEQMARRTFPEAAGRQPGAGGGAQPGTPARVAGGSAAQQPAVQPNTGWRRVPDRTQQPAPAERPPGWRQFGDRPNRQPAETPRTVPRATDTPRQTAPTGESPVRREAPARQQQPAPRNDRSAPRDSRQQYAPRSDAGSQWRQFGGSAESPRSSSGWRGGSQPAPQARGGEPPAMTWPRSTAPRSQPVRLNAPIVRERSAPSYQRSAPSYQSSAPRYERSAPAARGGGGGGGGAARSGSGGGSGSSRGGGGGHNSRR